MPLAAPARSARAAQSIDDHAPAAYAMGRLSGCGAASNCRAGRGGMTGGLVWAAGVHCIPTPAPLALSPSTPSGPPVHLCEGGGALGVEADEGALVAL